MTVQGWRLFSFHRSGRRYMSRPAANRVAARAAWDDFSRSGSVEWIQLLDGYWGCMRPGADAIEEREAVFYRRNRYA